MPNSYIHIAANSRPYSYLFWLGDLNFRLREDVQAEAALATAAGTSYLSLLPADELGLVRSQERAFHALEEAEVTFRPTYKFTIASQQYDPKYVRTVY